MAGSRIDSDGRNTVTSDSSMHSAARAISTSWRSLRSDQRPTGYCSSMAPRITQAIMLPTSPTSRPMRCRYSGSKA
ncbi:hypothetical protein D3C81_340560 [compost metagenome]